MKCIFAGETLCSYRTLQIMASFATEILFMDMPGVLFGDTEGPGRKSEARRLWSGADILNVDTFDPVHIGLPRATIEEGVRIDLRSSRFLTTLIEGMHSSGPFAERAIRILESCGVGNRDYTLRALLRCDQRQLVLSVCSSSPADVQLTVEAQTLKRLAIGFSVLITSGLFLARVSRGVLIVDDFWLVRLLQLRSDLMNNIVEDRSIAKHSEHQIAFSLYSESQLSRIEILDIVELRSGLGDLYASWVEKLEGAVNEAAGSNIGQQSAATLISDNFRLERLESSSKPLREFVQRKFGPPGSEELMPLLRYVARIPIRGELAVYKPNDARGRSDYFVPCLFIPGSFQ